MNEFKFIGNLTKDSESKYTPSGAEILSFSVAVNGGTKEKPRADYFQCKGFGKTAEYNRNLKKGQKVLVMGYVQTGSYQAKDGHTVYTTEFICNRIHTIATTPAAASEDDSY